MTTKPPQLSPDTFPAVALLLAQRARVAATLAAGDEQIADAKAAIKAAEADVSAAAEILVNGGELPPTSTRRAEAVAALERFSGHREVLVLALEKLDGKIEKARTLARAELREASEAPLRELRREAWSLLLQLIDVAEREEILRAALEAGGTATGMATGMAPGLPLPVIGMTLRVAPRRSWCRSTRGGIAAFLATAERAFPELAPAAAEPVAVGPEAP